MENLNKQSVCDSLDSGLASCIHQIIYVKKSNFSLSEVEKLVDAIEDLYVLSLDLL